MINIVPKPYYIMEKSGVKVLDKNSAVSADERLKDCICAFSDTFDFIGEKITALTVRISTKVM